MPDRPSLGQAAIVLLAGGRARRFPGKLEHLIGGEPMVARVCRAVRSTGWPVYVATNEAFSPEVLALLGAPVLRDRRPGEGPLAALVCAAEAIEAPSLFAVAADLPRLEGSVLQRLAAAWEPGDEAVVPIHDGRQEPLAALYARAALQREGARLLGEGRRAMHGLLERLSARFLPISGEYFQNVNSVADLRGETGWG